MLTRTFVLFTFGIAAILYGASQSAAQPGKGKGKGYGKGPEAGTDIERLEKDLQRLLEQVKKVQGDVARLKKSSGGRGGYEGRGKGRGFDWKKNFEPMKKEAGKGGYDWKKKFESMKKEAGKGKGPGGFGPMGKMDSDTIKQKYEFYKKLYEESKASKGPGGPKGKGRFGPMGFDSKKKEAAPPMPPTPPGKGKGPFGKGGPGSPGGPGSSSVEARLDRLIRELEELRSEVKGKKK